MVSYVAPAPEIYPRAHENPRAFFSSSSPILLEPLAHGSSDWSLPREDCINAEHLRENAFQEGGNDENPKTGQIQGPMTRSRTKQSVDTLQQMVANILKKAQVEKDEGPDKFEGLCQICSFLYFYFFRCHFGPN